MIIIPAFSVFSTASGEQYYAIRVTPWTAFWVRLWCGVSRLWSPLAEYRKSQHFAAYCYEQAILQLLTCVWLIRLGITA